MSKETQLGTNPFDHKRLEAGVARVVEAMRKLGRVFQRAGESLAILWTAYVEHLYRIENGKLPGSDRTSRLRKKRRDALWRWADQRFQ